MTCGTEYITQLHAQGLRMTPQRMTILHVLRHASGHLTPAQVYKQAQAELPGLTEPTVYRTLEFLARNGYVMAAHTRNGKLTYELTENNHHHLICRICGSSMEISHAPLEKIYQQIESSTGYKLESNHVTFLGLCPKCQS